MEAPSENCNRCGGPNVVWAAPSPLWNFVMRGNDINGVPLYSDLVCMTCFVILAVEAGINTTGWRLTVTPEPEDLVYETPSGRIWDENSFLWVEPPPPWPGYFTITENKKDATDHLMISEEVMQEAVNNIADSEVRKRCQTMKDDISKMRNERVVGEAGQAQTPPAESGGRARER